MSTRSAVDRLSAIIRQRFPDWFKFVMLTGVLRNATHASTEHRSTTNRLKGAIAHEVLQAYTAPYQRRANALNVEPVYDRCTFAARGCLCVT